MTGRLNLQSLAHLPAAVQRPDYDFLNVRIGVVHIGLGAFHRAHQALYTEDALRSDGGDWGILAAGYTSSGQLLYLQGAMKPPLPSCVAPNPITVQAAPTGTSTTSTTGTLTSGS